MPATRRSSGWLNGTFDASGVQTPPNLDYFLDHFEQFKRKHVAQNRDIIKSNAFLQIRIRELEEKVHQLEGERNAARAEACRLSAASLHAGRRIWLEMGDRLGFTNPDNVEAGRATLPHSGRIELDPDVLPGGIVRSIARAPEDHIAGIAEEEEPEEPHVDQGETDSPSSEIALAPRTSWTLQPVEAHDKQQRKSTKSKGRTSGSITATISSLPAPDDPQKGSESPAPSHDRQMEPAMEVPPEAIHTSILTAECSSQSDVKAEQRQGACASPSPYRENSTRSPSPVESEESGEPAPVGRGSRRSSVRARASVNYALPKLNTKMRKPDPNEVKPVAGTRRKEPPPPTFSLSAAQDVASSGHVRSEHSSVGDRPGGKEVKRQRLPDPKTQKLRPSRSCEGLSARNGVTLLQNPEQLKATGDKEDFDHSESSDYDDSTQIPGDFIGTIAAMTTQRTSERPQDKETEHDGVNDWVEHHNRHQQAQTDNAETLETLPIAAPSWQGETIEPLREHAPGLRGQDDVPIASQSLANASRVDHMMPQNSVRPARLAPGSLPSKAPEVGAMDRQRDVPMFAAAAPESREASRSRPPVDAAKKSRPISTLPSSLAQMASNAAWPSTPQVGSLAHLAGGDKRDRVTTKKVTALSKFTQQQQQRQSKAQTMGMKKPAQNKALPAADARVQDPSAKRSLVGDQRLSQSAGVFKDVGNVDTNEGRGF